MVAVEGSHITHHTCEGQRTACGICSCFPLCPGRGAQGGGHQAWQQVLYPQAVSQTQSGLLKDEKASQAVIVV